MDAHRQPGTRLIDAAIVLLLMLLAAWVAVIVVARSQKADTNARAGEPPPQGGVAGAFRRGTGPAGWKLVWHDEFDQARCPSRANWSFEHGFVRNGELQWYQPENAYCRDGVLVLEARREPKPNPSYRPGSDDWRLSRPAAGYTSSSIASKYSFTYGRAEALIRIDPRAGSWQDFWVLGTPYRQNPTTWPASGEVDITEYYRNAVRANICNPKRSLCGWSTAIQSLDRLGGQAWADRFHLGSMVWNARRIDLFLDGRLVNRFPVAEAARRGRRNPYVGQPAFMLFSQAIGGSNGGDPANTDFPVRLEVQYVRVYQRSRDEARRRD
jgi:beta-glucanase (GH16 family)